MSFTTIRSNALASDTTINDSGETIPGGNTVVVFDEAARLLDLQKSQDLRSLCTDDAHGAGSSTLILVDTAGADVPQGFIDTFLANILEDIPGKLGRNQGDPDFIYGARTQTPGALESDSVWQIYRVQLSTNTLLWADGSGAFTKIWSNRESITYI